MANSALTDAAIALLLKEPKPVTEDFRNWREKMRPLAENLVYSRSTTSTEGNKFAIYLRQHSIDKMDFSVGMRWVRGIGDEIQLVRCNGWHAEHTNRLERGTPHYRIPENTCHVHLATERYLILRGPKKIGFASPNGEFKCLDSALEYLIDNYGFVSSRTKKPFQLYSLYPW